MNNFVYKWTNHSNGKSYIGIHKGSEDDGYICSSKSSEFWDDFNNPNNKWSREILYRGNRKDCAKKESNLIKENFENLYNLSSWPAFPFTGEVEERRLASIAKRKGSKLTEEHKAKLREAAKGRVSPRKGVKLSEETKEKIRQARLGCKHKQEAKDKVSKAQKGRVKSEQERKNISEAAKHGWETRRKNA